MFQIAAAYAASKRLDTEFAINYDLPHEKGQGFHPVKYRETIYSNIPSTNYIPTKTYKEKQFNYSQLPDDSDILYDGYFQSERYFEEYKEDIKNMFSFSDHIKNKVSDITFKVGRYVSIGFRFGDYLNLSSYHTNLTNEYYDSAIQFFDSMPFIGFSDQPELIHTKINFKKMFIDNSNNELYSLYLLSQASSSIICNSSFFWWGAYLGSKKEKIIAPKRWFGPSGPKDFNDIFCKEWTVL